MYKIVSLYLQESVYFLGDLLSLLLLIDSSLILALNKQQILFELFAPFLLLFHTKLLLLNLEVNFLLLGQTTDCQVAAFTTGLQMSRDVLEDRVLVCHRFNPELSFKFRLRRHVILGKDFVLTA